MLVAKESWMDVRRVTEKGDAKFEWATIKSSTWATACVVLAAVFLGVTPQVPYMLSLIMLALYQYFGSLPWSQPYGSGQRDPRPGQLCRLNAFC
jgi:hypothetical protein